MRKFFVLLVLFSNSLFSKAQSEYVNLYDLDFKNDLINWDAPFFSTKFLLVPNASDYNGLTKKIIDNSYMSVSKYIDAEYTKPDSTFTVYYKDKNDKQAVISAKCNYQNGLKNGKFSLYYKNSLEYEGTYHNGKLNGEVKVFYQNGLLNLLINYQNDTLHGKQFLYYENGEIAIELLYKNDTINDFNVYKNGISYKINKIDFQWQVAKLHSNGKIAETYNPPQKQWNEILFCNYKNSPSTLVNFLLTYNSGNFKSFSSDGKLVKEIVYKNSGELDYIKNFDSNGKELIDSMTFFTGIKTSYKTTEKMVCIDTLIIKSEFKNGIKDGWERVYNSSGELIEETAYKNNLKQGWHIKKYGATVSTKSFYNLDTLKLGLKYEDKLYQKTVYESDYELDSLWDSNGKFRLSSNRNNADNYVLFSVNDKNEKPYTKTSKIKNHFITKISKSNCLTGLYDTLCNKWIIEPSFADISLFINDLAIVTKDTKYGMTAQVNLFYRYKMPKLYLLQNTGPNY